MKKCALCAKSILSGGHRDGEDLYCSVQCYASNGSNAFCRRCVESTLDEGTGDLVRAGFVVEALLGADDRCPDCHSVRQRLLQVLFLVPRRKGRFRVLYLRSGRGVSGTHWISRKVPQR